MAAFGCPKGISWCTALGALHLIASLVSQLVWSCSNCQWEQSIKRKKNWNWKNTERGESPSENEKTKSAVQKPLQGVSSGCICLFDVFLASDFNHFEVLTHRRHSEAILGQRRAQHIPTRARKHLTKRLPRRHVTKSEPIKIADFQDLLMLSHHNNSFPFCSVSVALLQLDVDRMPRHIHRNGILLSHPTCTQSFNLTGVSHFR